MTYRELSEKAENLLNKNKITLGEYEEMTKPLDREVEQEPKTDILDKIRAIVKEWQDDSFTDNLSYECMIKISELFTESEEE